MFQICSDNRKHSVVGHGACSTSYYIDDPLLPSTVLDLLILYFSSHVRDSL